MVLCYCVLYFSACRTRSGIVDFPCYNFLSVECVLVLWSSVLYFSAFVTRSDIVEFHVYFSACGLLSGIVELRVIYFCVWTTL